MKSIFKQYFRRLRKNIANSFITIVGFSISIAVLIILIFFVIQEKSYDKSYKNVNSIYSIVTSKNESFVEEDAKEILISKFPQIISACRYYNYPTNFVFNNNFINGKLVTTDDGFFDVFSTKFIYGNKNDVFSDIQSIVLTESFSIKIFKDQNPLGQIIHTTKNKQFKVTGVITDLPKQSSIVADCFINYKSKIHYSGINNAATIKMFVVVNAGTTIEDFEKEISRTLIESSKILSDQTMDYGESIQWKLNPFNTAYFSNNIKNDHLKHANISLIQNILLIAIIVLILAIINYINLTTADGISRINEIGVRRANGASNSNIFQQFLIESLITCCMATILAFMLYPFLIPIFENILGKEVDFVDLSFLNVSFIVLFIFILGITSGVYPAAIASKYSSIRLFQSKSGKIFKAVSYRNILNIIQFTISIILIASIIVILKQNKYSQNRNIGFNTSNLLCIEYPMDTDKIDVLKNKLYNRPGILSVSFSRGTPIAIGSHFGSGTPIRSISAIKADDKFIETFGLTLLHGRNIFYPSSRKECLITENAYKESEWKNLNNKTFQNHNVVGVINTFSSGDLHRAASNVMITNSSDEFSSVNIRISPNNISETLAYLNDTWSSLFPAYGFRYSFYNDWLDRSFSQEKTHAIIAIVFGGFSVILLCMGLIGITGYSIIRRSREIGIRKVNGAEAINILNLLNKEFFKLIVLSFTMACPLAFYILDKWLNNFAYKITLDWWLFCISGFLVFAISFITVSWRTWKTANRNPIDVLRYK